MRKDQQLIMNAPLTPLEFQQRKDREQLNLLSIFHFVLGGLALLGLGFLALHFMIMRTVMANPAVWKAQPNPPPFSPQDFMHVFVWFYIVMGFFCVVASGLNFLSGLFLRQRKHRTFSLVVAALDCLQIPLGTALGVFTFVILGRDSVRELYQAESCFQSR